MLKISSTRLHELSQLLNVFLKLGTALFWGNFSYVFSSATFKSEAVCFIFFRFLYVLCAFCAFLCFCVHYVLLVCITCVGQVDDDDDDDDDLASDEAFIKASCIAL